MSLIGTTTKGVSANSYVSLDRADEILGQRLYASSWFNASDEPDASGYEVDSGGASAGATSVLVSGGTGVFTKESHVRFGTGTKLYKVTSPLRSDGPLKIEPALTASVNAGDAVTRVTASDKEKALIWATRLLDNMMVWKGTKRTSEQALRWPRSGVVGPDGFFYDFDTIPVLLEEGTAELALVLIASDVFSRPSILGQGIEQVKLGPIDVKVGAGEREDVIPQNILSLLSPLGRLEPEAQHGTKVIPLRRS